MKWDPEVHTLTFGSLAEAEDFHTQLSALLRAAMVQATRHIEDGEAAKALSKVVLQDHAAVMRVLNALRTGLPRNGR